MLNVFRKLIHSIFFLLLSIFTYHCSLPSVIAGSGLVSSVGGATFIQGAKQFWVTSSRPTFSGITTAGAEVTGTVGSLSLAATADSSGNWSWIPSSDLTGDNTVAVTSGTTTVSFTLTIGQLPENLASASASSLAPAGSMFETIAILGFGIVLSLVGVLGLRFIRF